jgi:hypothetical protein
MLEGLGSGIRASDPVRSKLSEVLIGLSASISLSLVSRTDRRCDRQTTWGDDRWPHTGGHGILGLLGCNHSAAAWYVRGLPGVRASFASLWRTGVCRARECAFGVRSRPNPGHDCLARRGVREARTDLSVCPPAERWARHRGAALLFRQHLPLPALGLTSGAAHRRRVVSYGPAGARRVRPGRGQPVANDAGQRRDCALWGFAMSPNS